MADNILRSRRSTAIATVDADAAALETRMKHANAVAAAKQALPPSYANNPGAVLLAQEWAAARGVDLLTTIQTVSFIHGRPVVDATMQRALAMRAGYEIDIKVDDTSATCTLTRDGKPCGSSTYTLKDAERAKLTGKDNWKQNPKAMLVARATAQTMRWHAPDVMVGVFTEDEVADPLDTLAQPETDEPDAEIVEAEIIEPLNDQTWDAVVAHGKSFDPVDADALKAWIEDQGWTLSRDALTEDQAQMVLAWTPEATSAARSGVTG